MVIVVRMHVLKSKMEETVTEEEAPRVSHINKIEPSLPVFVHFKAFITTSTHLVSVSLRRAEFYSPPAQPFYPNLDPN